MKKLFIIIGVLFVGNLSGQTFTLKKCIEVAKSNNPTYQKTIINAEVANSNLASAKANKLPTTQAVLSQGMNFGRSIDRFSNDYINQLYNSTYGGLQVSMPVFKGFQKQYLTESAQILQNAETYNIETEGNRLSINILKAYLDVLATQELLEASKKQVENSRTQIAKQQKMLDAGTSGKLELIQFKNQVAADEGSQIDAEYNHQIARLTLFQLMNIKPNESVVFEQIIPFEIGQETVYNESSNPVEFLPEYKSLNLQSKSFEKLIKANKAENFPEVNLYGQYATFYASTNSERSFFQQVNDTRNGSFSLNIAIPIFSKFQNSPRTQFLNVQKKMVENTKQISQNTLNQDIETARLLLTAFGERYKNASKQVEISEENLKYVELRIDAGTINPIEFALAQTNLARANANQIQTKFRWILQKKLLGYYQSGEFDFL
ncbi:TolC family protein [Lacihabitans sp. LS3-19]|uniref:TolC family protein n=1 Tax=Lacihabitans sp. LS3-19 TaxID=2487335 RepID=UPI0020CCD997|nr:TolC family protein [Lacihabitans sp. LS3-19]